MFDYVARPNLLENRVILVTGAGRGIGAAAAKAYAAHGATVLLLIRCMTKLWLQVIQPRWLCPWTYNTSAVINLKN